MTEKPYTISWPLLLACWVALGTLSVTNDSYVIIVLFALSMLATRFTSVRMEGGSWVNWLARVIVFGTVITLNASDPVDKLAPYGLVKSAYVVLIGELFAAEMVLQAWRVLPSAGSHGGAILALSGMVFLTSCNTFSHSYVPWLTPIYMIFVLLSLRTINYPNAPSQHLIRLNTLGIDSERRARRFSAGRLTALFLAMSFGAFSSHMVFSYRNELNSWATDLFRKLMQQQDQVGLNSSPQLGRTNGMVKSNARILQLEAVIGAPHVQHLRAWAFEIYDQGSWKPNPDNRPMAAVSRSELEVPNDLVRSTPYTVKRMNPYMPNIFVPINCAGLSLETGRSLMRDPDHGNGLRVWTNVGSLTYHYTEGPENYQGFLCRPPEYLYRRNCLVVPPHLKPEVRALAKSIMEKAGTGFEKIRALESYFRSHHEYSLSTDPGEGDPVENFLLQRKSAHCEYFASGATILLRCMGIPARYVTGFYAFRPNGNRGILVRQRDAHAWCEAWIDGTGWVTVECTPASGMPDSIPEDLSTLEQWRESLADKLEAFNEWIGLLQWTDLVLGIGSLVLIWIFIRAFPHLRELLRRKKSFEFSYSEPERALQELSARFEKYLAGRGVPCPASTSWGEHLQRLEHPATDGENPAAPVIKVDLKAARDFAQLYTRLRFGGTRTPGELTQLAGHLAVLEQQTR